jgi:hypothetical protein
MSEFHTRAEIASNAEFIAYLEQLLSGSLTSGTGINRALERLAENQNALLDALQTAKLSMLTGGGEWAYSAPNFSFSSDIVIQMVNELGGARINIIETATQSPKALNSNGEVAYVKLDRTTNGASLALSVAASLTAFLTTITSQTDRLDYLPICMRTSDGITFFDGKRIKNGQSHTSAGFTDDQYGQQTELTSVHNNQNENFKAFLTRGGTLTWDEGTETFTWSADLVLEFPQVIGNNTVAASSVVIPVGEAAYFTMTRTPGTAVGKTFSVNALGHANLSGDNVFVAAVHAADGRLYLWDGTALSDGDSVQLGGLQSGVQFFYYAAGTAAQILDLTESGSYPERKYDRGAGALMVYRNGVKAKRSSAYWYGGAYPSAGSLIDGPISDRDEYVEEDDGSGNNTGNRIIWLADGQATSEPLYHASGTHDPAFDWPQADDHIEAFVGLAGEGPSPVEALQAFNAGGTPISGDPLDGVVGLQGSANITLSYSGNKIVITSSIDAGVSAWEVQGGTYTDQTGKLTFISGTNITLDDSTATELVVNCDIEDFEDLSDISADLANAVKGTTDPSASNVVLTHLDTVNLVGFDSVWTEGNDTIRTCGGVLRIGDAVYRNKNGLLSCTTSDLVGSETLQNDRWYGVYVGPGASSGDPPVLKISRYFPSISDLGMHPSEPGYAFLSTVYVGGSGNFKCFGKVGNFVCLNDPIDVDGAFASVVGSSYAWCDVLGESGLVDASWPAMVRLRLEFNMDGGGRGEARDVYIRPTASVSGQIRKLWSIVTDNDVWMIEFDINVSSNGFQMLARTADNFDSILRARITGYWEGRQTVAEEMGV